MRTLVLLQPPKLVFGQGCVAECARDLVARGFLRALIVTAPATASLVREFEKLCVASGMRISIDQSIDREPTISMFEDALKNARAWNPDVVIGLGGGSSLDAAKLIAAFLDNEQQIRDAFGINLLKSRRTYLVCLPTTSGTGSEVSPNAILLDEDERLKKGVVSPFLIPDATYVDPLLTITMPPPVTAGTGLDALTHCIEAYTNKFAHPMMDLYALQGIRLVRKSLARAVRDGRDLEAREDMSLASVYGGIVLGPVNTAAVHALSYPLGGEYHIPHGISNAVLLPHVMEFNLVAAPQRYADVAVALGADVAASAEETAMLGVERVRTLAKECGVAATLHEMRIPWEAVPKLAEAGMKVTRLLKNNPRELTLADATDIYVRAYGPA
jgi:alcohol dehydrogenase class IV